MKEIFRTEGAEDTEDQDLVTAARQGDRAALEALVKKHQAWIYNISWRMAGRRDGLPGRMPAMR